MSLVRTLAGLGDPAWLAVAASALTRGLGIADPARALFGAVAFAPTQGAREGGAEVRGDAATGARASEDGEDTRAPRASG